MTVAQVAATPPGLTVTVNCRLEQGDGRKLLFTVEVNDGHDLIGKGRHGRAVVRWDRFNARVAEKAARGPR